MERFLIGVDESVSRRGMGEGSRAPSKYLIALYGRERFGGGNQNE